MRWGRKWGNPWGEDKIEPLQILDFEEIPPAAFVSWPAVESVSNALYHVYVDGKFYDVTSSTELVVQFQDFGRHWVEVFVSGPGNLEEDLEDFLTSIPGTRVKLSWSASTEADHYEIYQDGVYAGRTKGDETCWISDTLDDGTYSYRVVAVDAAGNESAGVAGSKTISRYPNPPSSLDIVEYADGVASFSFDESGTTSVTEYRIYHNAGSGAIDYDTIIDTVPVGIDEFELSIPTAGTWDVGIRAWNVYEEDNVDVHIEFRLGGSPLGLLEEQPNTPETLIARPAANGAFSLFCSYNAYEELAKGVSVRAYTGGVLVGSAAISEHTQGDPGIFEVEITTSNLSHGVTYEFVVRAVATSGRESDDSVSATGTADAVAPANPGSLTLTEVNFEECEDVEW